MTRDTTSGGEGRCWSDNSVTSICSSPSGDYGLALIDTAVEVMCRGAEELRRQARDRRHSPTSSAARSTMSGRGGSAMRGPSEKRKTCTIQRAVLLPSPPPAIMLFARGALAACSADTRRSCTTVSHSAARSWASRSPMSRARACRRAAHVEPAGGLRAFWIASAASSNSARSVKPPALPAHGERRFVTYLRRAPRLPHACADVGESRPEPPLAVARAGRSWRLQRRGTVMGVFEDAAYARSRSRSSPAISIVL